MVVCALFIIWQKISSVDCKSEGLSQSTQVEDGARYGIDKPSFPKRMGSLCKEALRASKGRAGISGNEPGQHGIYPRAYPTYFTKRTGKDPSLWDPQCHGQYSATAFSCRALLATQKLSC